MGNPGNIEKDFRFQLLNDAHILCHDEPNASRDACFQNAKTSLYPFQGFSGELCQFVSMACDSNPCQHGGTCQPQENGYSCQCPAGASGRECENDIMDDCLSSPCQNGGSCLDRIGEWLPVHAAGFMWVMENWKRHGIGNQCFQVFDKLGNFHFVPLRSRGNFAGL